MSDRQFICAAFVAGIHSLRSTEIVGNFLTGKDQVTYTLRGNNGGMGNTFGKEDGDSSKGSGSDKNNANGDNSSADEGNIKNNLNNTGGKEVPKTGDTSLLFIWAVVAVLSGAAPIFRDDFL